MYNNYDYPCGTDGPNAPWNQKELPEKEIEVTVSITLSKTVKIKVSDYTVYSNEDDNSNHFDDIDYSDCDLKGAVEKQVYLPQEAGHLISSIAINPVIAKNTAITEDLSNWNVDEMEVILE